MLQNDKLCLYLSKRILNTFPMRPLFLLLWALLVGFTAEAQSIKRVVEHVDKSSKLQPAIQTLPVRSTRKLMDSMKVQQKAVLASALAKSDTLVDMRVSRVPDLRLNFGKKDTVKVVRPTFRWPLSYGYKTTARKLAEGAYSLPRPQPDAVKLGADIQLIPTTNDRIVVLSSATFRRDFYHCYTLDLGDELLAFYTDNKPFADQFFDRVPTVEELFGDLKFPLIVDFKSGSLAYYYDNEGVICFDYYEMWKPKEE